MSHLFYIVPLMLATGLVWLGIKYRRQSSQVEELHNTLEEAVDTLQSLNTAHREKASQQESTQEKLRAYLHLMDTVINTIPNPIFFKDEKGVYQGCNRVFSKQILGLTRDHIIGKRPQELPDQIPPDVASTHQREELKMVEKGGFHSFEAQMRCADGKRRDYLISLAPVSDAKGETSGLVAVMSDLTDKTVPPRIV
jgi:PAS domain S-box-containing protein